MDVSSKKGVSTLLKHPEKVAIYNKCLEILLKTNFRI